MRKLNITEDMAEDRKQWMQHVSHPTSGHKESNFFFKFKFVSDYRGHSFG